MGKIKDISNQKFGRLTTIRCIKRDKFNRAIWLCKCDCGNFVEVKVGSLTSGNTKSCGCLRKEITRESHLKHNRCDTRLYRIYYNMRSRCYYEKSNRYKNYGDRGIRICDEWLNNFEAFYNWAIENGYRENLTIDRINNNKGYSPDNCRWINNKSQARNRRSNKNITFNGETHCLKEWCEILNLDYHTTYMRLNKYNWSVEKCLQTTKNNV